MKFSRKDYAENPKAFSGKFQITNIRHGDYIPEDLEDSDSDSDDDKSKKPKYKKSPHQYRIQLFGLTTGGATVRVDINDFKPYFFIKVSKKVDKDNLFLLLDYVCSTLKRPCREKFTYENSLVREECEIARWETLEGFTNGIRHKFVKLVFKSYTAMRRASWQFDTPISIAGITNKDYNFIPYEHNIEPYIRFLHEQDIAPAAWVNLNKYQKLSASSMTVMKYYQASHTDIVPLHEETSIAPFISAAFDIECMSSTGGFPKASNRDDPVNMICTTFLKYPDKKSFLRVIHTLKPSDPIDGVEIIYCKTEKDLLISWRNLIQGLDPDFIYGYNSNGFDFAYLHERAKMNHCKESFMRMSRDLYEQSNFIVKQLSSSALGDNVHRFIDMPGRIVLDIMKEIQKEHKLDTFKLDAVAEHFTKENKVDLSPKQMFQNYSTGTPDLIREIGIYCLQDTELCHRLQTQLTIIIKAMKMANVCNVPTEYIFFRGQGVKIFSLISKICRSLDILVPLKKKKYGMSKEEEEKAKLDAKFDGALVIETSGGIYHNPVVVLDFNSLYPSCQIGWNISHDTHVTDKKYSNLPGVEYHDITYNAYRHEYQTVPDKTETKTKRVRVEVSYPVTCTFVQDVTNEEKFPTTMPEESPSKYDIGHAQYDINNYNFKWVVKKKSANKVEWVREPIRRKGIIPMAVQQLLKTRKDIKKKLKKVKDTKSDEYMLLDCEQLAYKIVANSIFGQTGASTSPINYKHVAACTTAKGREMLMKAKDVAISEFNNVNCIYGDTDSNFYELTGLYDRVPKSIKDPAEKKIHVLKMAFAQAQKMSDVINAAINKPGVINFEYEKTFLPFLIATKKRYYARKYEFDPTSYVNKVMGLATKKRNYCTFTKTVMQGIFDLIMEQTSLEPETLFDLIKSNLNKLINHQVDPQDLIITAALKSDYKNYPAHWYVAQDMKKRGETVNENDRIAYVYSMQQPTYNTLGRQKDPKVADIAMEYNYLVQTNKKYDPEQYIKGQLEKPITEILKLAIKDKPITIFKEMIKKCQDQKIEMFGSPIIPKRGQNKNKENDD